MATYVKTGIGGMGVLPVVSVKTGLGVSSFVGSGTKSVANGIGTTYNKTGIGTLGITLRSVVKAGGGVSAFIGSGSKTKTNGTTSIKTGGGHGGGTAGTPSGLLFAVTRPGGFVGSGSKLIISTGTYTKSGTAISAFIARGAKVKSAKQKRRIYMVI